ncbi:MAG: murein transglycosylase A [Legionellaceae bacterium]|nr:murein transglycosylase A [Legionellaceae bacterium]
MKKVFVRVLLLIGVVLLVVVASLWFATLRKSVTPIERPAETPVQLPEEPVVPPPQVEWKETLSFNVLPGWDAADLTTSFKAFNVSCDVFLRQAPDKMVGSRYFPLKAKEWHPVCRAAKKLSNPSNAEIKAFFEAWFNPGRFYEGDPIEGLFTGYYVPVIPGSLKRTDEYTVPIYALPRNWVTFRLSDFDENLPDRKLVGRIDGHHIYPFHTRAEINKGAIDKHAPVLVWLNDQVDRLFLEIQGSGLIELPSGREMSIGYAGQNGAAYTSIASVLIRQGVLTTDTASMQNIRAYFKEHPDKMQDVLNQNKSFVFFEKQRRAGARGAQGVFLTAGYSLAVDRSWVPLGAPIWLNTERPDVEKKEQVPLQRLFIAQDTGGAIKGPVRGDVFWGNGEKAGAIAGRMKNKGVYWVMLPRDIPREGA